MELVNNKEGKQTLGLVHRDRIHCAMELVHRDRIHCAMELVYRLGLLYAMELVNRDRIHCAMELVYQLSAMCCLTWAGGRVYKTHPIE